MQRAKLVCTIPLVSAVVELRGRFSAFLARSFFLCDSSPKLLKPLEKLRGRCSINQQACVTTRILPLANANTQLTLILITKKDDGQLVRIGLDSWVAQW